MRMKKVFLNMLKATKERLIRTLEPSHIRRLPDPNFVLLAVQ